MQLSIHELTAQASMPLKRFTEVFSARWDNLEQRFLKIESLQHYREEEDPAYGAFRAGNMERAVEFVKKRIYSQKPMYESAKKKGVKFVRIRIVERPIDPYLRYEFASYRFSSDLGEQILVVEGDSIENHKKPQIRDMLIFDDKHLLVHDYDNCGILRGGWECSDGRIVGDYANLAAYLISISTPLADYEL